MNSPRESAIKNVDRISAGVMRPRKSAWLHSSSMSFGAGVAVQHSRYGVALNAATRARLVTPLNAFRIDDSSRTTAPNRPGSIRCSRS